MENLCSVVCPHLLMCVHVSNIALKCRENVRVTKLARPHRIMEVFLQISLSRQKDAETDNH